MTKYPDDYHFTAREAEVLKGISLGLTTKDLAQRLEISPNTVRSFLRLIMIKMGVKTRAELFARILERQASAADRKSRLGAGAEGQRTGMV